MSNGNSAQKTGNERKTEKSVKKQIKHDPQAESARTKFGKRKPE